MNFKSVPVLNLNNEDEEYEWTTRLNMQNDYESSSSL